MNVSEILKRCPKGTELYSTVFGDVYFQRVLDKYLIEVTSNCGVVHQFFPNGSYSLQGECVLFPSKKQRDWSKFRLSVKNGDIMMLENGTRPFIFRKYLKYSTGIEDFISDFYCGITKSNELEIKTTNNPYWTMDFIIPASEEAKKELFDKIAESGYKWNADTLKLEKIEPKFKEGDIIELDNVLYLTTGIIKNDKLQTCCLMKETTINVYEPEFNKGLLNIATLATKEKRNKFYSALIRYGYEYDKNQHKLVKQEFKPFDMVLVRNDANKKWSIELFSYYDEEDKLFPYVCLDGCYHYCIPYKDNEYLLGKAINPYMI